MRVFRLALAQINPTVGDLQGNTSLILNYMEQARTLGADLVAFPELAIPGYPPEDLLFKPQFIQDNLARMHQVVRASKGITVVVGFVDADSHIHNAAAVAYDGRLVGIYHKMYLPNYGVFDEERYFQAGRDCSVYVVSGTSVGVNVCEDIWHANGPTVLQRGKGAEVIVNINGSPFHSGKAELREKMLGTRAVDNELFVAYVNMVGGQDELVFDGASMIIDPTGEVVARGSQFKEDLIVADLDATDVFRSRLRDRRSGKEPIDCSDEVATSRVVAISEYMPRNRRSLLQRDPTCYNAVGEMYEALVMGTRDYVRKSGFSKVLVALSGGIDSSLVATLAVDALGTENVVGVFMPSRYSSDSSLRDAREVANRLGIQFRVIPIEDIFTAHLDTLAGQFNETEPDITEENLQSRIRGNLIMALSNKFGWMVLATGNKSEMAVGYATIYGDMAGGYAVIKDVPKTMVYRLVHHRNSWPTGSPVPSSVLEKSPTAELRFDQRDQDSLPPYEVLDPILKAYVEDDLSFDEIVAAGFDEEMVRHIIIMVDRNEYKRRQSPPGIKITPRNFGRDRRMPIANSYMPF